MFAALRKKLNSIPALATLRLLRLNFLARTSAHQDLSKLGLWQPKVRHVGSVPASLGTRVLIATTSGGHFGLAAVERVLGIALSLRGANVTTILCDSALSACQPCEMNLLPDATRFAEHGPRRLMCSYCYPPVAKHWSGLGLPTVKLGAHLSETDRRTAWDFAHCVPASELGSVTWEGINVGEHAYAGALRYFARGTLQGEPAGEKVVRRYLAAAIETAIAYQRLIDVTRPDVIVLHHGIYIPQGVVTAVAHARGVRVVTWNPAYRRHTFIFSHADTYHHTLLDEPTERWAGRSLTERERETIVRYLHSRREGREDWIRFHKRPDDEASFDLARLGIDPRRPYCVAFTNVFWDAQLHYRANAFATQREWLLETIQWFSQRPDLQLVIRVHPAELSGSPPSRQFAIDEIKAAFSKLPPNIAIVSPESAVSSYVLAERADAALIYGTKMGVELAAIGIPVIVAGEAWVKNKGLTLDAGSMAHYRELLACLPLGARIGSAQMERALAYAHHFFFRRMIPIKLIKDEPGSRQFTVSASKIEDLFPGNDPGLDVICDGILHELPFEMELLNH